MNTPPPPSDLDPAWIATALAAAWSLPPVELAYDPVGFGSHHWLAREVDGDRQWFVTADTLVGRPKLTDRLPRALRVAWHLRHDAAIEEVVAPLRTTDGQMLATIGDGRWALALYPSLPLDDPGDGAYPTDVARLAAQRLVARIHNATWQVPAGIVPREDFAIPGRDTWRVIAGRFDEPWGSGPYSEPARRLLRQNRHRVEEGLVRFDALARAIRESGSPWVITHGEPHAANIVARRDGAGLAIVDWDTVALAPKERDLYQLLSDSPDPVPDLDAYFATVHDRGDRAVSHDAIAHYRLRWDLSEIFTYAKWFADPHEDTEDTRLGWDDLTGCAASLDRQLAAM